MDHYKKVVAICLLGSALVLASERGFRGEIAKPRIFVALLITWLFLGFLAEFSPKLAAYFSGLVFVGILLQSGPYVFKQLEKRIREEG